MRILGVVLSGGRSTRMGTDKAALMSGGQSWLNRAQAVLREAGADAVWLSGRPEGVADLFPGKGPVGGIASVLPKAQDFDTVVFVPVDMPHLTAAHLTPLIEAATADAPAACYNTSPLPFAVKRARHLEAVLTDLTAALNRGETWPVKGFLAALGATHLLAPAAPALDNINTPDELSRLETLRAAVITVTRANKTPKPEAAHYLKARLTEVGYAPVEYTADESIDLIRSTLTIATADGASLIVTLGGTGPGQFDLTPEAIEPLLDKRFDGFSVLFHMYSHQSAGLSAMLSRAFAGTIGDTLIFALPGSVGAVTDAWEHILSYHLSPDRAACSLRRVVTPKAPKS